MQAITLPELPQLKGEEAIKALQTFMSELEKRDKALTKKQTKTLKKLTKALITSIKAEKIGKIAKKETGFVSKLRHLI